MAGVSQRTVYELRKEVSGKIARLPLKYLDSQPHGEILSRVTNDMDLIGSTLQQSMTQVIEAIVTIVGILIMMLLINHWLTFITLLTLPLSFAITTLVTRHSQKHFANQQRELGELNGHIEEMYGGHLVVKAFNYEKESLNVSKQSTGVSMPPAGRPSFCRVSSCLFWPWSIIWVMYSLL